MDMESFKKANEDTLRMESTNPLHRLAGIDEMNSTVSLNGMVLFIKDYLIDVVDRVTDHMGCAGAIFGLKKSLDFL